MNQKAKELGMVNTYYLDSTGLTDEGHYSTTHDIAILSRALLTKYPKVMDYSMKWMDTFRNGTFRLDNTNKLVKYYQGTTGLKTGFTTKAGYCLSVSAKHDNTHLVAVVLGEPDSNTRFAESRKLLDHGFTNFQNTEILKKGEDVGVVTVEKGKTGTVRVVTKDSFTAMLSKEEQAKVKKEPLINSVVTAPIDSGAKVGEFVIKIDDKEVGRVDLVSTEAVEKASFILLIIRKIASWFGISL
jgi:D-alanyl-D-alanine carboxypeptidase (penicillin-binding protein 5/6)